MEKDDEYTDRGGAKNQNVDWRKFYLGKPVIFIHCGSAPLLSQGGDGLLLKFAKENITVTTHLNAPRKFILAFPTEINPNSQPPEQIQVSKACQLLWDEDQMPYAYLFRLKRHWDFYARGSDLKPNREVAFPYDITFGDMLFAEYKRSGKSVAKLVGRGPACKAPSTNHQ
jgi:hypothetical protein